MQHERRDTGLLLPDHMHELRENETVVELTVHTWSAWLSCRDGVIFECPVCKDRGITRDGGKPVALDTRAADQANAVRGVLARVWQGNRCVVCRTDITVVLAYMEDN